MKIAILSQDIALYSTRTLKKAGEKRGGKQGLNFYFFLNLLIFYAIIRL